VSYFLNVIQRRQKRPLLVADKLGHAHGTDGVPTGADRHGRADKPLFVPDDDTGTRG
jgi:hypothetical protein